jgi:menaquinone-dependent protoporphyrinogen oxidase
VILERTSLLSQRGVCHSRYAFREQREALMEPFVLVTYATKMGSTKEVARSVAEELRSQGFDVDLLSVDRVESLAPYTAVVVGAALYMGRLHRDARRFFSRHREQLGKLPVALFVLGPINKVEKDWAGAQQQFDRELARLPWFAPIEKRLFGGCWDPAKMKFPFNVLLRKAPAGDARDWDAIRAFAEEVASKFQPAVHA